MQLPVFLHSRKAKGRQRTLWHGWIRAWGSTAPLGVRWWGLWGICSPKGSKNSCRVQILIWLLCDPGKLLHFFGTPTPRLQNKENCSKTEHRVPLRMKYGASMAHCPRLRRLTNIDFLESMLWKGWFLESFSLRSSPNEHSVESFLLGWFCCPRIQSHKLLSNLPSELRASYLWALKSHSPVALRGQALARLSLGAAAPKIVPTDIRQLLTRPPFVVCTDWRLLASWCRAKKLKKFPCHGSSQPGPKRRQQGRRKTLHRVLCPPHCCFISQNPDKSCVVFAPTFYQGKNSETLSDMSRSIRRWDFFVSTLLDMGRDDRGVKRRRRKGHWVLIPGQKTWSSKIYSSECQARVTDAPLHVPPSLCFLRPRFQGDNCQVRLGPLVSSAWNPGRSSCN